MNKKITVFWLFLASLCFAFSLFTGIKGCWTPMIGLAIAVSMGFLISKIVK